MKVRTAISEAVSNRPANFLKTVTSILEEKAELHLSAFAHMYARNEFSKQLDEGCKCVKEDDGECGCDKKEEKKSLAEDVLDNLRDISASGKENTVVFLNGSGLVVTPAQASEVYAAFDAVKEPAARMELIRLLSLSDRTFLSVSQTLVDSAKPLQESLIYVNGAYKEVKNLGWLLRNWTRVEKFEVKLARQADEMTDAVLIAHLEDGQFYSTLYASLEVLKDWLNRPIFRGLPVAWPNGQTVSIGSPEFRTLRTEIIMRQENSMIVPDDAAAQMAFDFGDPQEDLQESFVNGVNLDSFTMGYFDAMLASDTDESTPSGGYPLDRNYSIRDFSQNSLSNTAKVCEKFQRENQEDLNATGDSDERLGQLFYYERGGAGVGFWDQDYEKEVADRLSKAARSYHPASAYIGDDGKLYVWDEAASRMGLRESTRQLTEASTVYMHSSRGDLMAEIDGQGGRTRVLFNSVGRRGSHSRADTNSQTFRSWQEALDFLKQRFRDVVGEDPSVAELDDRGVKKSIEL